MTHPTHDSPDTALTRPQHARIEAADQARDLLAGAGAFGTRASVDPDELLTVADWILTGRTPLEDDPATEKISPVVVHTNEHDPAVLRGIGIEYPPRTSPMERPDGTDYPYGGDSQQSDASGSMAARSRYAAEALDTARRAFVQCGAVDGTRVCAKGHGHAGRHRTAPTPDGVAAVWDDPPAGRTLGEVVFVAMVGEPWESISEDHQEAGESAARAVIAWHEQQQTEPEPDTSWSPVVGGWAEHADHGRVLVLDFIDEDRIPQYRIYRRGGCIVEWVSPRALSAPIPRTWDRAEDVPAHVVVTDRDGNPWAGVHVLEGGPKAREVRTYAYGRFTELLPEGGVW